MQTTKDEVEEILEKLLKNLSSEELEVLVQQKQTQKETACAIA